MSNKPYQLFVGDSLLKLKDIADESIDSVVTDPPYGLSEPPDITKVLQYWLSDEEYKHDKKGFMNNEWDSFVPNPSLFKELYRVLKPGAHILCFSGTRTVDLMGMSIRLAGFEIRDQISWVFGSGFPKSHNISKALSKLEEDTKELEQEWDGWGTGLKPATEPIIIARKPISESSIARNVIKHGTGAINIDGSRVGEVNGRFPANLIHDGSEEIVKQFPKSKGQLGKVKEGLPSTTGKSGIYGSYGAKPESIPRKEIDDSSARFFYCSKTTKADREDGLNREKKLTDAANFRPNHLEKAKNGESGNPYGRYTPLQNNHPTVKPTDLMRYLTKLVTPPNGIVLDPFLGSGSTGRGAMLNGFKFIGIDLNPEYVDISKDRIEASYQENLKGLDI